MFRLFNILTSFQNYIIKILPKKPIIFIIIYLDKIFFGNQNKLILMLFKSIFKS